MALTRLVENKQVISHNTLPPHPDAIVKAGSPSDDDVNRSSSSDSHQKRASNTTNIDTFSKSRNGLDGNSGRFKVIAGDEAASIAQSHAGSTIDVRAAQLSNLNPVVFAFSAYTAGGRKAVDHYKMRKGISKAHRKKGQRKTDFLDDESQRVVKNLDKEYKHCHTYANVLRRPSVSEIIFNWIHHFYSRIKHPIQVNSSFLFLSSFISHEVRQAPQKQAQASSGVPVNGDGKGNDMKPTSPHRTPVRLPGSDATTFTTALQASDRSQPPGTKKSIINSTSALTILSSSHVTPTLSSAASLRPSP
ncbi:uncharacterized protein ARMOST_18678 [Armillaria ostoyae]|uniref:Uncharacterized protein n=1 Tax=Armillaria ostoyae TaxID=47428 RepID=A0A284S2F4_ARMOS|nr:uncharacterized protein ARMOST_18678 [Armillaria ostoyae]